MGSVPARVGVPATAHVSGASACNCFLRRRAERVLCDSPIRSPGVEPAAALLIRAVLEKQLHAPGTILAGASCAGTRVARLLSDFLAQIRNPGALSSEQRPVEAPPRTTLAKQPQSRKRVVQVLPVPARRRKSCCLVLWQPSTTQEHSIKPEVGREAASSVLLDKTIAFRDSFLCRQAGRQAGGSAVF